MKLPIGKRFWTLATAATAVVAVGALAVPANAVALSQASAQGSQGVALMTCGGAACFDRSGGCWLAQSMAGRHLRHRPTSPPKHRRAPSLAWHVT